MTSQPESKLEERQDFFNLPRPALAELLEKRFELSRYRATQLYQWVYQKGVHDLGEMTNIKKPIRCELKGYLDFPELLPKERQVSRDGTRKFLYELDQGEQIESVLIKQDDRLTLCVSSQVGCALGCKFCRTATMGLKRNLSTSEIVRQVQAARRESALFNEDFSNIVFMGMGEPLHNFDNLMPALEILTDDHGLGLSHRKITVSTVGLVPAIKRFGESGIPVNLAVSLNATTDEVRSQIMPINRRFPIAELIDSLKALPLKGRQRITIEYVMLAGVNDSPEDLKRLAKILRQLKVKINLIPYNENAGLGFKSPTREHVRAWLGELLAQGYATMVRWSKGSDIDAACGQLATTKGSNSDPRREQLTAIG